MNSCYYYFKKCRWNTIFLLLILLNITVVQLVGQVPLYEKPRLLVLTDIGGDPDDIQSLRRLLVYSNEFQIKGLIATATSGEKESRAEGVFRVNKNLILDAISDYEKVKDNLQLHAHGYPTADELRAIVFNGQPNRGVEYLVQGRSTEGSNHIITTVDNSDDPLNIVIWGGAHDLAQALLDVKSTRKESEISEFISKIRVYAIGDQDKKNAQKGTGEWIIENFPQLFYIHAGIVENFSAVYRGMYQNDSKGGVHPESPLVRPGIERLNNTEWVQKNVLPFGDLGANYPSNVNQNPNASRNTSGVKEGDTPSWFYFLLNGLNDIEHPNWGCWGGRFEHIAGLCYGDAQDDHWSGNIDGAVRRKWTVARWKEAYQNDFATRMRWCILPYEKANHNPVPVVDGDSTKQIIYYEANPGTKLILDAGKSFDPDGDQINYKWWIYQEISSFPAILSHSYKSKVTIELQDSETSGSVHVILEVTDCGTPNLIAYRRIILNVASVQK